MQNLSVLWLIPAIILAYGTAVVEQAQHDTTIVELYKHIDKVGAQLILAAPAHYRAQVGQNKSYVVEEGYDRVAALIRVQVICHDRETIEHAVVHGLFSFWFIRLLISCHLWEVNNKEKQLFFLL